MTGFQELRGKTLMLSPAMPKRLKQPLLMSTDRNRTVQEKHYLNLAGFACSIMKDPLRKFPMKQIHNGIGKGVEAGKEEKHF